MFLTLVNSIEEGHICRPHPGKEGFSFWDQVEDGGIVAEYLRLLWESELEINGKIGGLRCDLP